MKTTYKAGNTIIRDGKRQTIVNVCRTPFIRGLGNGNMVEEVRYAIVYTDGRKTGMFFTPSDNKRVTARVN